MAEEEAQGEAGADAARRSYPIIGIGAGSTAADELSELIGALELNTVAVVVVEHVAAERQRTLSQALRQDRGDKVIEIEDGTTIEPGKIFVVAEASDVAVFHGTFHVMPLTSGPRSTPLPIDFFLRALAADQGESAIGVILAGTAPDGTFGLQAIKAEGGLTFVQDHAGGNNRPPGGASHADFALPPADIAAEINKISQHPYVTLPGSLVRLSHRPMPLPRTDELGKLFVLIRSAFGTDLSFYKRSTLERRIERRMIVARIERLEDYVRYVQNHTSELEALYKDCLIGVTSFFRDHEPFEALKAEILPQIFERKRAGVPLRVWVPGCATGEEAYSIVMCIFEYLEGKALDGKMQIFATDLDADAIAYGRRGIYPPNIAHDVSPARLARFFVRRDGDYQVTRRIRDNVVFAVQDVTRGPPFSHVDVISCRNLLIYLQPAIQKKVLRIFHYALNPDGALLLGSSETIGDSVDMFTVADKQQKLYTNKNTPSAAVFDVSFGPPHTRHVEAQPHTPLEARPVVNLQQQADRKVIERYGPPGVLINESMEILQFRGRLGSFLEPMPGTATLNLLKLARPELLVELRGVVQKAMAQNATAAARGIQVRVDGKTSTINIEVLPLHEPETRSRCLLVLFEPSDASTPPVEDEPPPAGSDGERARTLERELVSTKEYLQQIIEELESANEELKSSNEELQSSNEELQSTNEELETSKEELQSTNEELNTVNDELQSRMGELSQANDDLINLIGTSTEPTIIVGQDLKIRRFTSAAERLFNLIAGDVGRALGYLKSFFAGLELEPLVVQAVDEIAERREEALGADGRWYRIRIVPYKTADKAIRGAVLSFADIDAQRRRGGTRAPVAVDAVAAVSGLPVPVAALDRDQRVVWANRTFYGYFRTDEKETLGNLLANLGNGQWAHPKLHGAIERALGEGTSFRGFRIEHEFEAIGQRSVLVSGARVSDGGAPLVILTFDEEPARTG